MNKYGTNGYSEKSVESDRRSGAKLNTSAPFFTEPPAAKSDCKKPLKTIESAAILS